MNKLLLIQPRAIGDVLCTTPVINYLNQILPDWRVDFLVEPVSQPVVETHPGLNEILVYDKKKGLEEIMRVRARRYDAVLDFMNNPRTGYITAFSRARWKVGFKRSVRTFFYNVRVPVPEEPEYVPRRKIRMVNAWLIELGKPPQKPLLERPVLHLTAEDEKFADDWVAQEGLKGKKFAIIMPIHKHEICRWRPEGFQWVARALAQKGISVYFGWGPGEETKLKAVHEGVKDVVGLRPPDGLRKIAAVFKRSALVLANNSGSMHLAVSVGAPTVTIYGPTRAIDWNPSMGENWATPKDIPLMAEDVACLGCRLKECPVGHLCMTHLSERSVLNACESALLLH